MNTTDKNILVTGGTGFVGSYVIRDLVNKGYRVSAIRRRKTVPFYIDATVLHKINWIDGDILDPDLLDEAMHDADAVIHAAANVSFSSRDYHQMTAINVEGTANVVNAAIDNNVARFVHVSSVAALGRSRNIHVDERQQWQDNKRNTHYAISKYRGELEVWRAIAEGLQAVIVNPSTILGYGNWNTTSNALFKNAYKGFPWYTNGVNGFVDVEDVSRAIVYLMETGISSERFILNSENWSYRQLLDTLAEGFDKRKPHREATPFLAGIAWRLENLTAFLRGRQALLTKESAKVARGHTEYDNAKIRNAIPGFRFRPLQETIKAACEKYLRVLQE